MTRKACLEKNRKEKLQSSKSFRKVGNAQNGTNGSLLSNCAWGGDSQRKNYLLKGQITLPISLACPKARPPSYSGPFTEWVTTPDWNVRTLLRQRVYSLEQEFFLMGLCFYSNTQPPLERESWNHLGTEPGIRATKHHWSLVSGKDGVANQNEISFTQARIPSIHWLVI